jgi:hypothetical protein
MCVMRSRGRPIRRLVAHLHARTVHMHCGLVLVTAEAVVEATKVEVKMPTQKKPKTAGAAKRPETKQDLVLRLLRRKTGATLAQMMEATDWQEHSVRGFLSAVVRKKLGLNLVLEGEAGKRRYRIIEGKR